MESGRLGSRGESIGWGQVVTHDSKIWLSLATTTQDHEPSASESRWLELHHGLGNETILLADSFPTLADAEGDKFYGEGGTDNATGIGYARAIGGTTEARLRAYYLGDQLQGVSDGEGGHREGGEIDPTPAGFHELVENYQNSPENTYHLEADTATESEFSGESTSVTVHITQADGTVYEILLDTVTTPRTGVRRYSGEQIVEFGTTIMPPGELHTVEFELSDGSMVDLHTGTKMSVITDDAILSAEHAESHGEVAIVHQYVERVDSRVEQLEAGLHHEATNTRLIRRFQASTILPPRDTNVEWMDWFDGDLYLISPAHANSEPLGYYPNGGATRDGLHWYFAQDRYLRSHDVTDPDSTALVEAEWQAEGATERSYGLAVDSEYAGTSVADTLWQLITDGDDIQIVSRTPSTVGAMVASQVFDVSTGDVNTALGTDFDDLAAVSNDGSDRLGAIDIGVRGSDLFLLIHAELTEGSHTVPIVLPFTIDGTGDAKTLTVDGDSKRIVTAVGEVKSFVEGDNNDLYVCNEDIVYEFEEIGSSDEVPVPALGDEQRILSGQQQSRLPTGRPCR